MKQEAVGPFDSLFEEISPICDRGLADVTDTGQHWGVLRVLRWQGHLKLDWLLLALGDTDGDDSA
jgi:hypothetical protein